MKQDELEAIERVLRRRNVEPRDYLFCSERGAKLSRYGFWRIVSEAGKRAGLPMKAYAHQLHDRDPASALFANPGTRATYSLRADEDREIERRGDRHPDHRRAGGSAVANALAREDQAGPRWGRFRYPDEKRWALHCVRYPERD